MNPKNRTSTPPEGFFLFNAADGARVAAGDLTVTWRLWKYPHVRPGKSYPAGSGSIYIEDVRQVRVADVTDADAREAGLPDATALIDLARAHKQAEVSDDTLLYRVQFHYSDVPPEKPQFSLEEIARRIARLDAASPFGPWTETTLRLIEENPGVVSTRLAAELDMPRLDFKANVRKLKALGLTESLMVGYELSILGQSYLDSIDT